MASGIAPDMFYLKIPPSPLTMVLLYFCLFIISQQITSSAQGITETDLCEGDYPETRCHLECPSNCTYTLDNATIISNCTDGSVMSIPVNYPSDNVTSLRWNGSTLHSIRPASFTMFASTLLELDLGDILLKEIINGVFEGLKYLKILNLGHNALRVLIPGLFDGQVSLEELKLDYNALDEIQIGTFQGLAKLERLDVSNNSLSELKRCVFEELSSLEFLHLNNNVLNEIYPGVFMGLRNLTYVNLDDNSLQKLQPGIFGEWRQVYNASLHAMETELFADLESLKFLSLHRNKLREIHPSTFAGLTGLKELHLAQNELQEIHLGTFEGLASLEFLGLFSNSLHGIVWDGVFDGLTSLNELHLSRNELQEICVGAIKGLVSLEFLGLHSNSLQGIPAGEVGLLTNLRTLWLQSNKLSSLHPDIFKNLTKLEDLALYENQFQHLPERLFHSLVNLRYLNLFKNHLTQIPVLSECTSLQTINLTENPLLWITAEVFLGLDESVQLLVTNPSTCCYATSIKCNSTEEPARFLTCTRLLTYDSLRIVVWVMCIIGTLGNTYALINGIRRRQQQRNKIQFLLITNLSISDFTMCIYLLILVSADLYYADYFPSNSEAWRESGVCRFAGALSVLSSEASAFLIMLISVDRYLRVKYRYPFGTKRLTPTLARFLLVTLWLVALTFSIASFVLPKKESNIYAVSEVCIGLPISKDKVFSESIVDIHTNLNRTYKYPDKITQYKYTYDQVSMYLSIAMFTGFNFICFLIVGFCYTFIFIESRKTSQHSRQAQRSRTEINMATRISLLVPTDFCCWVPVGVLSILVQAGAVEVSPIANAWIATFVLPINSALNPFLYNFSGLSIEKVKCPCCKQWNPEEEIPMREIGRHGGLTEMDETRDQKVVGSNLEMLPAESNL